MIFQIRPKTEKLLLRLLMATVLLAFAVGEYETRLLKPASLEASAPDTLSVPATPVPAVYTPLR